MSQERDIPFLDTIQCGDNNTLVKKIPDKCIDLIITSPPYFQQRDYGGGSLGTESEVNNYIDALLELLKEELRILKPEGNIVYNIGDKYKNGSLLLIPFRFAIRATEELGLKLINNITWVKSNPTPRQYNKRLVNSTEPFFHFAKSNHYYYDLGHYHYAKPQIKKTPGANFGKRYYQLIEQSKLTPEQKEIARTELGDVIEDVRSGLISGFRMKISGIHSLPFGGQEGGRMIQLSKKGFTIIRIPGNSIKRDVVESAVETIKGNIHPAVYPKAIIEDFINLLSPPNGIVLDPYIGSGTTAMAAIKNNRHYIGFEIVPQYCDLATSRLAELL
ncbi:MAG: site-specific DNA-methyltransferase [Thermoplasmatales archaeon]